MILEYVYGFADIEGFCGKCCDTQIGYLLILRTIK